MGDTRSDTKRSLQDIRDSAQKALDTAAASGSPVPNELHAYFQELSQFQESLEEREQALQGAVVSLVDDMSEKSQTLADTGMRLEGILEAAEDVAFIIASQSSPCSIIEFNPGAARMFGYDRDEVMGESPALFYAEGIPDHRSPESGRLLMRRKSGEIFPAMHSSYPLKSADGTIVAKVIIVLDISIQERAEQYFKEAHERYTALARVTPVSIMAFDGDGVITFVNDWHMRMLDKGRMQPEMYIGKKVYEIPGIVRARAGERIKAVLKGKTVSLEDVYIPAFGVREESWHNIRSSPLMVGDEVRGGILIREDVTRRKRTELDLKMLIDRSPIPIIKVELTEMGRMIRSLNPEAADVFGPSAVGKSLRDYITPVQQVSSDLAGMHGEQCDMRTREGIRQAIRTVHKTSVQYEVHAVMDVSELVHAKEAAEDANRAKSDFLANISHELRTPLNGLLGVLQLFRDNDLGEELNEMAEYATAAARSLLALLNDILDFTQAEAGTMELDSQNFVLSELVELVIGPYRAEAAGKNVELEYSIDSGVPDAFVGDQRRLRQIIFHLVGNGVKFTDSGHVSLEVGVVENSMHSGRCTLAFSVSDTGIGMDEKEMEHIFEPFRQADGSRTRRHGGTGIGLTLVHEFVEAMGGEIGIDSRKGEGTRVSFTVDVEVDGAFLVEG